MNKHDVRILHGKFWNKNKINLDVHEDTNKVYPKIYQNDLSGLKNGDTFNSNILEYHKNADKVENFCKSNNVQLTIYDKTVSYYGVTLFVKVV